MQPFGRRPGDVHHDAVETSERRLWSYSRMIEGSEEDPADETLPSGPRSVDGQLLREGAWAARPRAQEDRCVRLRPASISI